MADDSTRDFHSGVRAVVGLLSGPSPASRLTGLHWSSANFDGVDVGDS